ncbi:TPA: hypothetical protein ACH3X2_004589 [Trebouxia sp. C0005]
MLDLQATNAISACALGPQTPSCRFEQLSSSEQNLRCTRLLSHRPSNNLARSLCLKARQRYLPGRTTALWNAASGNGTGGAQSVDVTVERAARNSRRLYAAVQIAAPIDVVWGALTDYEGLGNFIPGLTENRCLSKKAQGATLLQVGEQDVAFGAKFRARVVLDIQEHGDGTPQRLCSNHDGGRSSAMAEERLYPLPRAPPCVGPCKDVCFSLVEGDFQAFRGIWRMQQGSQGPNSCRLSYALFVRPQVWLPIRLIQNRVENEIKNNLTAVQRHSEALYRQKGSVRGAKQL